jgi:hypothetical protein
MTTRDESLLRRISTFRNIGMTAIHYRQIKDLRWPTGHVNRLKMFKRQMFGRAKPDLLGKRVLLTD